MNKRLSTAGCRIKRIKSIKLDGLTLAEQVERVRACLLYDASYVSTREFAKWAVANRHYVAINKGEAR